MKPATVSAAALLTLIGIGHVLRILFRVEVTAGGAHIPMWVSWIAVLVTGILAFALWREGRRGGLG